MNYFGVYHGDCMRTVRNICDAPCISKGQMALCAGDIASEGDLVGMAEGRIRNRKGLAEKLGCSAGMSASGLVLKAYMKWGENYPEYIEGPAVTCIMDARKDMMIVSRDRMGEKMLFYTNRREMVCFSDHPDSLLKTAAAEPVMDVDGLRELFGIGPARTPGLTPFKEIRALEAGCALILKAESVCTRRYFNIEAKPHEEDIDATIEHTRALLEQAVDDILPFEPAVMLSGGLDSTALTALVARKKKRLLSFSVDYRDNARDFTANAFRPEMDAPYVEQAVRAFSTQHRTVILEQADLAKALGRAVSLRGFPGMADIDSSLFLFAEKIARYTRHVVSGECGDEVFCGYPWFNGNVTLPEDAFPWSGSIELRESILTKEAREKLRLKEYVSDVYKTRVELADPGSEFNGKERRLKTMQKLCFDYFMSNLQERAVFMCEGAGISVLTPLCDDRLVSYVYNVPGEIKFMGGQEKGLFREAVRDILPENLLRRKKSPYPKTCSPVYGEIIRRMAAKMVSDTDAPVFEWVDREAVMRIVRSDLNPADTPWYGQLMAGAQLLGYLWQINAWLRDRNVTVRL
ncbi:MAG: asparagine synthetase B [Clostridia bacterium]|nr:asparagine synthetase B [Clostridia bacterium]